MEGVVGASGFEPPTSWSRTNKFKNLRLALASALPLLSNFAFAQEVVTARASIPFNFWAQDHEFQAGDYVFDNEVPGSASIHREGTNSGIGISIILYDVPPEKENPGVIFVRRDEKYLLVEIWGVQDRWSPANSNIAAK